MSSFRQQIPLASELLNALVAAKSSLSEDDMDPYWRDILKFSFSDNGKDIRRSKNNAIVAFWCTINATIGTYTGPLKFSTGKNNEVCLGKIGLPENSEVFEKLREVNPEAKPRMNLNKISVNCNKYKDKNNTEESSIVYQLVELISQIFEKEISNYTQNGVSYIEFIKKTKAATKNMTVLEVIKAYDAENPNIRLGGQILLTDDCKSALKKTFPDVKDVATLFDKLFVIPYTKMSSCIQSSVPENAKTNGGAALANPYVRMLIECNSITGLPKPTISDFEKGKETKTNVPVLVNGSSINIMNIHEAIPYGTEFRGKFNMSEICFSKVAISLPLKVDELVIMKSNFVANEAKSSWYDSDDDVVENAKAPTAVAADVAAVSAVAAIENDVNNSDESGDDLF